MATTITKGTKVGGRVVQSTRHRHQMSPSAARTFQKYSSKHTNKKKNTNNGLSSIRSRRMVLTGLAGALLEANPNIVSKIVKETQYSRAVAKLSGCLALKQMRRKGLSTPANVQNAVNGVAKVVAALQAADPYKDIWSNVHDVVNLLCQRAILQKIQNTTTFS